MSTHRIYSLLFCALLSIGATFTAACGGEAGGDMEILDMQPRTADLNGDKAVRILGRNFRTDIGYTVYFGNQRAQSVTILSPEELIAITPVVDEPKENLSVTVRADNGPAFEIASAFTFSATGTAEGERGNLQF